MLMCKVDEVPFLKILNLTFTMAFYITQLGKTHKRAHVLTETHPLSKKANTHLPAFRHKHQATWMNKVIV